jgi:hypothetical protein
VYNNFAKLTAHLGHWQPTLRRFSATGQELRNSLPVQGDASERRRPALGGTQPSASVADAQAPGNLG